MIFDTISFIYVLFAICGVYAIVTGKLMIAKSFGLRDGARLGGLFCVLFPIGSLTAGLFSRPARSLSDALGIGSTGTAVLAHVLPLVAIFPILGLLILLYGNNHSEMERTTIEMANRLAKTTRSPRPFQFRVQGKNQSNGQPNEFLSRAATRQLALDSAVAMGLDPASIVISPLTIPSESATDKPDKIETP
ncbi:MAG: hypothetical protein ABSB74_03235 [Tepidisphaeraceae bacterium]